jgi:ATP-dependent protease Clp ATPase subunit
MKARYCSFCGKEESEVFYLVWGPTVFICDECVILVADVIQEQRERVARGEPLRRGSRTFAEFKSDQRGKMSIPAARSVPVPDEDDIRKLLIEDDPLPGPWPYGPIILDDAG